MINRCVFSGRVISVKYNPGEGSKKSNLNISVSVPTGEAKKEGDQYPPSFVVQATLWEKYADTMQALISVGQRIILDGQMTNPYVYERDGELKSSERLFNVSVELIGEYGGSKKEASNAPASAPAAKAKTTSRKAASQDEFEDMDDDLAF